MSTFLCYFSPPQQHTHSLLSIINKALLDNMCMQICLQPIRERWSIQCWVAVLCPPASIPSITTTVCLCLFDLTLTTTTSPTTSLGYSEFNSVHLGYGKAALTGICSSVLLQLRHFHQPQSHPPSCLHNIIASKDLSGSKSAAHRITSLLPFPLVLVHPCALLPRGTWLSYSLWWILLGHIKYGYIACKSHKQDITSSFTSEPKWMLVWGITCANEASLQFINRRQQRAP